jgi:hypothetical protein
LINQRSFVKVNPQSEYYLEPVTLKEITNLFVQNVVKELMGLVNNENDRSPKLIESHSFVVGDDKDINDEQMCRIVRSISEQLLKNNLLIVLQQRIKNQQIYCPQGYSLDNFKILFQSSK